MHTTPHTPALAPTTLPCPLCGHPVATTPSHAVAGVLYVHLHCARCGYGTTATGPGPGVPVVL